MIYILIIIAPLGGSSMQEFSGKEACDHAASVLHKGANVLTFCVPKGAL